MAGNHLNIVVAVRCYNESKNIDRFMRGYDFADTIVVSDSHSEDDSVSILKKYPKVHLVTWDGYEVIAGHRWSTDGPHMNFVLNEAKRFNPDWLILDDMDDVPNYILRENARYLLEHCDKPQVNAFRLYMWGDDRYFPHMNRNFNPDYTSLWAWKPKELDIHADNAIRHGTVIGVTDNHCKLETPYCLLHKSWHPDTIDEKIARYNALQLPMSHPLEFAGTPEKLPEWAVE